MRLAYHTGQAANASAGLWDHLHFEWSHQGRGRDDPCRARLSSGHGWAG